MGPTKRCNTCGEDKPSSGDECAFNKKAKAHDGLQSKCRVCSRKATREHYENNKSYYVEKAHDYRDEIRHEVEEIKKRPCQDCKRSFPPCCMSFIHRDSETNTHIISALAANGRSRDLIMDEMSKCDLVCANCERIRSHAQSLRRSKAANEAKTQKRIRVVTLPEAPLDVASPSLPQPPTNEVVVDVEISDPLRFKMHAGDFEEEPEPEPEEDRA